MSHITEVTGTISTNDGVAREFRVTPDGYSQWGATTSQLGETVDALTAISGIVAGSYEDDAEPAYRLEPEKFGGLTEAQWAKFGKTVAAKMGSDLEWECDDMLEDVASIFESAFPSTHKIGGQDNDDLRFWRNYADKNGIDYDGDDEDFDDEDEDEQVLNWSVYDADGEFVNAVYERTAKDAITTVAHYAKRGPEGFTAKVEEL